MNKITLSILLSTATVMAFVPGYARYYGDRHGGYNYNTASVETKKGEVTTIDRTRYGRHHNDGVHVALKTDGGTIMAYLGPEDYLGNKLALSKGDLVEITGSVIDDGGKKTLVAREIKKGSTVVVLREKDGTPLWAGTGMGRHRR